MLGRASRDWRGKAPQGPAWASRCGGGRCSSGPGVWSVSARPLQHRVGVTARSGPDRDRSEPPTTPFHDLSSSQTDTPVDFSPRGRRFGSAGRRLLTPRSHLPPRGRGSVPSAQRYALCPFWGDYASLVSASRRPDAGHRPGLGRYVTPAPGPSTTARVMSWTTDLDRGVGWRLDGSAELNKARRATGRGGAAPLSAGASAGAVDPVGLRSQSR